MAACLIETARLSYPTTNSMSITTNQHLHVQSNAMETTTTTTTKKRQFNRSNTFHANYQLPKTITDNSCSNQAVTTDNMQASRKCP